jgi:hypothetical protein
MIVPENVVVEFFEMEAPDTKGSCQAAEFRRSLEQGDAVSGLDKLPGCRAPQNPASHNRDTHGNAPSLSEKVSPARGNPSPSRRARHSTISLSGHKGPSARTEKYFQRKGAKTQSSVIYFSLRLSGLCAFALNC